MDSRLRSLLPVAALACCPAASSMDEPALAALLEEARGTMKMPGLRAAVRYPDGRIVLAATGMADVEASIPLDNEVGMPGGSTGKTFAAALTMLLVEDGLLSLDDHAARWLGDADWYADLPNADQIRIRHLLSHSAGLSDYPQTMGYRMGSVWRVLRRGSVQFEPEELIGFATTRKSLYPVGEGFRYTDAGYLVLGRVIEAATGRRYYDLLGERILEPLELHGIRPQDRSILSRHHARLHLRRPQSARRRQHEGRPVLRVDRRRPRHDARHARALPCGPRGRRCGHACEPQGDA